MKKIEILLYNNKLNKRIQCQEIYLKKFKYSVEKNIEFN